MDFVNGYPAPDTASAVHHDQRMRRALEAYHFFFPSVSLEAILTGTRATGAVDNRSAPLLVAGPRHVG